MSVDKLLIDLLINRFNRSEKKKDWKSESIKSISKKNNMGKCHDIPNWRRYTENQA